MAGYIADQSLEPAWVATHSEPIVKASLSFLAKFWWAVVRSRTRPTLANNTLMLEHAVLVANISASYDVD